MKRPGTPNPTLVLAFLVLPGVAFSQAAATAKPVNGSLIKRNVIAPDESVHGSYVLFGNATVGLGQTGADPSTVNMAQMKRSMKDAVVLPVDVSAYVSLGGLVANGADDGGKSMASRLALWHSYFDTVSKAPFLSALGSEALGADGRRDERAVKTWLSTSTQSKTPDSDYTVAMGKDRLVFVDAERDGGLNTSWLSAELSRFKSDKNVDRVFVFGSRPLVSPPGVKLDSRNAAFVAADSSAKVRNTLASHPKVVGYFCGSPAMFNVTPLEKDSKVSQVIVGNSGGPLEPGWTTQDGRSYGFTLLVTYSSGRVSLIGFRRSEPTDQSFFADGPIAPQPAVGSRETILWEKPKTSP